MELPAGHPMDPVFMRSDSKSTCWGPSEIREMGEKKTLAYDKVYNFEVGETKAHAGKL